MEAIKNALTIVSSIGLLAWVAFVLQLVGIGVVADEAWRGWDQKGSDRHWRGRMTASLIALSAGAVIAVILADVANSSATELQQRLNVALAAAGTAQAGVDAANRQIAHLRATTTQLNAATTDALNQAQGALVVAQTGQRQANAIDTRVKRYTADTQTRLKAANALAKSAAARASSSEIAAGKAAVSAAGSKRSAENSALQAEGSRQAALAAEVNAGVYRISDAAIAAIKAALSAAKPGYARLNCPSNLIDPCRQLADAFRSANFAVDAEPNAAVYGGFDADPFASHTSVNLSIAYMPTYYAAAVAIDRALAQSGLTTKPIVFPPATTKPSLEIILSYVGRAP